ncbi:MAG: AlpA family transcriptional regulator [Planctomycetaceae bacterium]|nr:AlpA family transcriptional regulator [Planctomycetaceae bacterium]
MQKLLTLRDLMPILNLSEATIRRRISERRTGIGNFPKPITASKRKLLFHPDEIDRWANCQQSVPVAKIESPTQHQHRHTAAMNRLKSKGVRVPRSKPLDDERT